MLHRAESYFSNCSVSSRLRHDLHKVFNWPPCCLLPPKIQAPRSRLRGSQLLSRVAGIFATFSIQFMRLWSKISLSDLIPRCFLSSLSIILWLCRSRLVILDIAQNYLLKRTLRFWHRPAVSAHDSQPQSKRLKTISLESRTQVTSLRDWLQKTSFLSEPNALEAGPVRCCTYAVECAIRAISIVMR